MLLVPAFRLVHVLLSTIISLLVEDVKHIEKIDWGHKNTYYQRLTLMTGHRPGQKMHTKRNGLENNSE